MKSHKTIGDVKAAMKQMRDMRVQTLGLVKNRLRPGTAVVFFTRQGDIRRGVIEKHTGEFKFMVATQYPNGTQQLHEDVSPDDLIDETQEIKSV